MHENEAASGGGAAVMQALRTHPFALDAASLRESLVPAASDLLADAEDAAMVLRLPGDASGPWPSDRLGRLAGVVEPPVDPWLGEFEAPALRLAQAQILPMLLALDADDRHATLELGASTRYWIAVARFVIDALAQQRFIPTLIQSRDDGLRAAWRPWLHESDAKRRVGLLLAAMPPSVRAVADEHAGRPWPILEEALGDLTDSFVRRALHAEQFIDAIDGRDPADAHVAWLSGLLDGSDRIIADTELSVNLLRDASLWVGRLEDAGKSRPLRLCLRLREPQTASVRDGQSAVTTSNEPWILSLHLQSSDDPSLIFDAKQIWESTASGGLGSSRIEHPQELLLAELGRAGRIYPRIESVLSEQAPTRIELDLGEAYSFLRNVRPVLEESGVGVIVPEWWDQPLGRLGARLHIDAPEVAAISSASGHAGISPTASVLGLNSLVKYRWQVAIGDQPLTSDEFNALAKQTAPLVQVRGRWIEISPQQLKDAREFLQKAATGEMTLLEAIQVSHGGDSSRLGLPVVGMDATGWVADVLGASTHEQRMPSLEQPESFGGTLRPYQKSGLSWLAFLDRFGLGACLADDMGLGKTIQLIAMLLHERLSLPRGEHLPPTLLIVPTSVVSNWRRELERFAPSLTMHIQHGPDRPQGDRFIEAIRDRDVVITTYPLISRDQETLQRVKWHRVALDEAQYIKNPPTKQTTAIRSLHAPRRLALTGTPVENRLSELWSIMEFCNPGYLGPAGEFRRRFAVPIERHRDGQQAERLRHMVRPFILRRLKTDPKVITDLPDCLETKDFATLTAQQAALYQQVVNNMLGAVDRAQGMQRRGLVLATLVKLKQICNHPAQYLNSAASNAQETADGSIEEFDGPVARIPAPAAGQPLSSQSGKARRLMVMLEEVLATGERALVFTQFRQMGHLLTAMIQEDLDREALFLHGGTPAAKRQAIIDRFQAEDGGAPVFVLSLKAGGVGLNLTAANHVFHYDRWWNPAVENQATDRAFRIGQTRAVHVHKFVCVGTLEERIDQMIEQKTELAQNIIGSGESWLTELSSGQLRDLLMLRPNAVEADS